MPHTKTRESLNTSTNMTIKLWTILIVVFVLCGRHNASTIIQADDKNIKVDQDDLEEIDLDPKRLAMITEDNSSEANLIYKHFLIKHYIYIVEIQESFWTVAIIEEYKESVKILSSGTILLGQNLHNEIRIRSMEGNEWKLGLTIKSHEGHYRYSKWKMPLRFPLIEGLYENYVEDEDGAGWSLDIEVIKFQPARLPAPIVPTLGLKSYPIPSHMTLFQKSKIKGTALDRNGRYWSVKIKIEAYQGSKTCKRWKGFQYVALTSKHQQWIIKDRRRHCWRLTAITKRSKLVVFPILGWYTNYLIVTLNFKGIVPSNTEISTNILNSRAKRNVDTSIKLHDQSEVIKHFVDARGGYWSVNATIKPYFCKKMKSNWPGLVNILLQSNCYIYYIKDNLNNCWYLTINVNNSIMKTTDQNVGPVDTFQVTLDPSQKFGYSPNQLKVYTNPLILYAQSERMLNVIASTTDNAVWLVKISIAPLEWRPWKFWNKICKHWTKYRIITLERKEYTHKIQDDEKKCWRLSVDVVRVGLLLRLPVAVPRVRSISITIDFRSETELTIAEREINRCITNDLTLFGSNQMPVIMTTDASARALASSFSNATITMTPTRNLLKTIKDGNDNIWLVFVDVTAYYEPWTFQKWNGSVDIELGTEAVLEKYVEDEYGSHWLVVIRIVKTTLVMPPLLVSHTGSFRLIIDFKGDRRVKVSNTLEPFSNATISLSPNTITLKTVMDSEGTIWLISVHVVSEVKPETFEPWKGFMKIKLGTPGVRQEYVEDGNGNHWSVIIYIMTTQSVIEPLMVSQSNEFNLTIAFENDQNRKLPRGTSDLDEPFSNATLSMSPDASLLKTVMDRNNTIWLIFAELIAYSQPGTFNLWNKFVKIDLNKGNDFESFIEDEHGHHWHLVVKIMKANSLVGPLLVTHRDYVVLNIDFKDHPASQLSARSSFGK